MANYYDSEGRADAWSGGVRMIEISTPLGPQRVWTKRVGNNPKLKLLLLHGGPGASHSYLECFEKFLPQAGIEFYLLLELIDLSSEGIGDLQVDGFVLGEVNKAIFPTAAEDHQLLLFPVDIVMPEHSILGYLVRVGIGLCRPLKAGKQQDQ